MFNTDNYFKSKQNVIELIKQTHFWDTTEGFIADGLINPDEYLKSKMKIAFILGESYGYDECGMVDIINQQKNDILGISHRNRQTSKKAPALLWYLTEHYSLFADNTDLLPMRTDIFNTTKHNVTSLQSSLSQCAWINVKKASRKIDNSKKNPTRQDEHEIYSSVKKNKEILKLQLESIDPDLIIACSNPVINGLIDNKIINSEFIKTKNTLQKASNGKFAYFTSHPSYYKDWGYENVYEKYKTIILGINQARRAQ